MKLLRSFFWALALAQIVFVGVAPVAAEAAQSTSIHTVRYHVEPGRTRIWFETSGAVLYTQYSPDPLTLVIDFPGVDISGIAERTVVGSREVESIVTTTLEGMNGKALSRIEINLAALVPYQISASPSALTVLFDATEVADSETDPPEEVTTEPAAQSPVEPVIPLVEDEPEGGPDKVGEVVSIELPVATAEPDPELAGSPPATVIHSVTHNVSDELLAVTVTADGRLSYTSFRLDGPKRLVFDFNGVINLVTKAQVPIDSLGVHQLRIAQYRAASPRITRLVFDLQKEVPHTAVERVNELTIYFAGSPETLAEVAQAVAVADFVPTEPGMNPTDEFPGDGQASDVFISDPLNDGANVPGLEPIALVAQSVLSEIPEAPPSFAIPALPEPPPESFGFPESQAEEFVTQTIGAEETSFTGELISLDFKDGDIQDIFRLFADISGLNVVVQPGVTGRITLKLTEVPWDQAMDIILKTHRLGYIVDGNVIRIAPVAELASEEEERRRLAEEKALAGDLTTMTRQLSYAKATELEPLIMRNLSARGDIVIDTRTNTLIVTDLPDQITNINTLIDTLDTAIPGVEISARVVVTTRNFARRFGIQWGFTSHMDQFFGNATELVFPSNILIDGQSIGSLVTDEFKTGGLEGGLLSPALGADDAQRGYAINLPLPGAATGAIGLSLGSITGAFGIDAALAAAESQGQVRIISAPRIITQNNMAATIKQGVTFPVQTVANNTVTVTFKDAVLELEVTPQITSANTIILDINVNNDTVDFSNQVNGIPSIQTQEATTQVLVADGSTTVVGGVFQNTIAENYRFVPLLHRIPFLGKLFKSGDTSEDNRELLIFITPRIRKDDMLGG